MYGLWRRVISTVRPLQIAIIATTWKFICVARWLSVFTQSTPFLHRFLVARFHFGRTRRLPATVPPEMKTSFITCRFISHQTRTIRANWPLNARRLTRSTQKLCSHWRNVLSFREFYNRHIFWGSITTQLFVPLLNNNSYGCISTCVYSSCRILIIDNVFM